VAGERYGMAYIEDDDELDQQPEVDEELDDDEDEQEGSVDDLSASAASNKNQQASVVPDKYRGKNLEDIVKMHQEAEQLIGRQAQEVGEVRKLADELLKQQLSQKKVEPPQDEPEMDFFENPQRAIQNAVENHPDVKAAKQASQQMKQMQLQNQLQAKHPDFSNIVQDGDFVDWVKASPVRLRMYADADTNYNFETADELLSTYKQLKSIKAQGISDAGKQVRKQAMKAAGVDVGGSGETTRKTYRRADLIRLRMTDPDRYMQLSDEIMKAYDDGRVK
jgi:hypothetical protein